jgi:hypothetical protein
VSCREAAFAWRFLADDAASTRCGTAGRRVDSRSAAE